MLADNELVKVDEVAVVVPTEASNCPAASLAAAVELGADGELEVVLAHQIIPPIMAMMIMPAITYTLEPVDVSDFMMNSV